jgi:undecaprenyl-diphosphatase
MVVLVAPVIATTLFNLVKRVYARPRPLQGPVGGRVGSDFSFPSGHGTTSAAVCCTLAYVLWREGVIGRTAAITLAVAVPLLVGGSRVYLNVHWTTDVLGGWCLGILIASLSIALYERLRLPNAADPDSAPSPTIRSSAP